MPEDPSQPLTSVVSIRGCRKRDRQKTRVDPARRGGGGRYSPSWGTARRGMNNIRMAPRTKAITSIHQRLPSIIPVGANTLVCPTAARRLARRSSRVQRGFSAELPGQPFYGCTKKSGMDARHRGSERMASSVLVAQVPRPAVSVLLPTPVPRTPGRSFRLRPLLRAERALRAQESSVPSQRPIPLFLAPPTFR